MPNTEWSTAPPNPQLSGQQIHIWRVDIAPSSPTDCQDLESLLTESERVRAKRFLAAKHRGRFVLGRARMRQILGRYANQRPEDVELQFENLGKPFFADQELNQRFQFNFSNSSDLAICAVTLKDPIGVDLERVREMSNMLGLAKRFFANSETERLLSQPSAAQPDAFFRLWTRKEAWLKAIGKGLTFPLRDVEVTFDDENCCVHSINQDEAAAQAWELIPFFPAAKHVGAVAIQRKDNIVSYYEFA